MSETSKYKTSNPYESKIGYSRAVRRGPFIFVSGTTAVDALTGLLPEHLTAYDQAVRAIDEIFRAIVSLGGQKEDITRVRLYVREDNEFDEVARAVKEKLGEIEPAATGILGVRFVSPEMKVEIEADAVVLP